MTTTGGARESVERALTRIEAESGRLNAFITVAPEAARAAADAAAAAAREGRWLGLLHGMTMAVKDCIDTAGLRTTGGPTFFANRVPNEDAAVVARLRRAGAVLVGKATLQELCFGIRSVNPISGQCHNPWDTERVPGGSGVALADDMVQGALGSDTAGRCACRPRSVAFPGCARRSGGCRTMVPRNSARSSTPSADGMKRLGHRPDTGGRRRA